MLKTTRRLTRRKRGNLFSFIPITSRYNRCTGARPRLREYKHYYRRRILYVFALLKLTCQKTKPIPKKPFVSKTLTRPRQKKKKKKKRQGETKKATTLKNKKRDRGKKKKKKKNVKTKSHNCLGSRSPETLNACIVPVSFVFHFPI